MAVRGVAVEFKEQAPSVPELLARAERLAGLPLHAASFEREVSHVAFRAHPEQWVQVSSQGPLKMFLFTVNAPTLYLLLWQAAGSLGGSPASPPSVVPSPLTLEFVRWNDRADTLRGSAGIAGVAGTALIGVGVVLCLVWLLSR